MYAFVRLELVHNQFIFLLCNTLLRGMYVLRYGWYLPTRRWAFVRLHYSAIAALVGTNIIVSYFRDRDEYDIQNSTEIETIREEIMLTVMLCFLQVLPRTAQTLSRTSGTALNS